MSKSGPNQLFLVEGYNWEYDMLNATYSLHIPIGEDHLCVWAIGVTARFSVSRFRVGMFSMPATIVCGPLEALCIVEEAIKEAKACLTSKNTSKPT